MAARRATCMADAESRRIVESELLAVAASTGHVARSTQLPVVEENATQCGPGIGDRVVGRRAVVLERSHRVARRGASHAAGRGRTSRADHLRSWQQRRRWLGAGSPPHNAGVRPIVYATRDPRPDSDSGINCAIARRMGINETGSLDEFGPVDLIVDGLFGTGLDRPVTGELRACIE